MHSEKYVSRILASVIAVLLAGCGSNYNSNTTSNAAPVSGIKKRVLISNITPFGGVVAMADAQKNVLSTKTFAATQPSKMVTAKGQTLILNSTVAAVTVLNNSTEVVTGSATMQGQPFDVAISPDGLTGYAAIKNVGVVEVVNMTSANLVGTMTIPSVTRLVEGTNGHKMLAFADDPEGLAAPNTDAFFVIDTGTNTAVSITMPAGSQPFTAVFDPSDSSDQTAFILNCGFECGGTVAPSVVKMNFSNPSSPVTTTIPVFGATAALLVGSNLFVAGTPTTPPAGCTLAACGTLQVINTSSLTAGAPINITDGSHNVMAVTTNNNLYIGSTGCTVGAASAQNTLQGCLSIFNTSAGPSATNPSVPRTSSFRQGFDVTGLQPISGENVIWVIQGGALDVFDINTSLPSTSITPIDVVGRPIDALLIDP